MIKIGDVLTVEIEHLTSNGKAVAHLENIDNSNLPYSIFVEFGVPGDILKVEVKRIKKIFIEANIVRVVKSSPNRVDPICPYFKECGACDWLNIDYDLQIKEKQNLLKFFLERNKISLDKTKFDVIKSENPLFYRKKIRLNDGFFKKKSNQIINVKKCYIIDKKFWDFLSVKNGREVSYGIDEESQSVTTNDAFYFYNDIKFKYSPDSFVQSNFDMNRKMIEIVSNNVSGSKVLDLYSGNGNFSIPIAMLDNITKVSSVEGSIKTYSLLLENMSLNGVSNIDPFNSDVRDFVKRRSQYDTIILDPPRTGSSEILPNLASMTNKIIYVSCNSELSVKEIKILLDKGFKLDKVFLLDLFPQTRHFESIFILTSE